MVKELEALEEIVRVIPYLQTTNEFKIVEKALKDYQEIKEIAKHYNWQNFTSSIFDVETDRKWQNLFNAGIMMIQEDYRKARALDIIIKSPFIIENLVRLEKLGKEAMHRYNFGTITNSDVAIVEEFFKDEEQKRNKSK